MSDRTSSSTPILAMKDILSQPIVATTTQPTLYDYQNDSRHDPVVADFVSRMFHTLAPSSSVQYFSKPTITRHFDSGEITIRSTDAGSEQAVEHTLSSYHVSNKYGSRSRCIEDTGNTLKLYSLYTAPECPVFLAVETAELPGAAGSYETIWGLPRPSTVKPVSTSAASKATCSTNRSKGRERSRRIRRKLADCLSELAGLCCLNTSPTLLDGDRWQPIAAPRPLSRWRLP